MATTRNKTKKIVFITCGHGCHRITRSKKAAEVVGVEIYISLASFVSMPTSLRLICSIRASGGAKNHNATHTCFEAPCALYGGRDRWPSTAEEIVKFAARLHAGRADQRKDLTIDRYREAWEKLHPGIPAPMNDQGCPVDFSLDSSYICPNNPAWLAAWIDGHPQVSGSAFDSSGAVIAPGTGPFDSNRSPDFGNTPARSASADFPNSEPQSPARTAHLTSYLLTHGYEISSNHPNAQIVDFVPGYRAYEADPRPKPKLKLIFILMPEFYVKDKMLSQSGVCCDDEIDPIHFENINNAAVGYITLSRDQKEVSPGLKRYFFHSWVSVHA